MQTQRRYEAVESFSSSQIVKPDNLDAGAEIYLKYVRKVQFTNKEGHQFDSWVFKLVEDFKYQEKDKGAKEPKLLKAGSEITLTGYFFQSIQDRLEMKKDEILLLIYNGKVKAKKGMFASWAMHVMKPVEGVDNSHNDLDLSFDSLD